MDSLTQVVLGATVGEAVAGPRVGRRAALWGALAGTLPDLDILAYPFLDAAGELRFHRGLTHGLAFAFIAGPLLGGLVWRIERWRAERARGRPEREAGTWRLWGWLAFWALLTHPLLDVFTVYGTQLLAPFSDRPFAVGSVFIIDPLYTVPLAVCLGVAVWAGRSARARRAAFVGLALSTAYLGWGVGAQAHVRGTVETAYAERGIEPERLLIAAGPLTTLWWRGIARVDGAVEPFSVHLLDPPWDVAFGAPIEGPALPPRVADSRMGRTLAWFSRGWLVPAAAPAGSSGGDSLFVADPRFGRLGAGPEAPFVFMWAVGAEPPHGFAQRRPAVPPGVLGQIASRFSLTRPEETKPGAEDAGAARSSPNRPSPAAYPTRSPSPTRPPTP